MSRCSAVRKLKGSESNWNLILLLPYKAPKSNKTKNTFHKYNSNKRRVKENLHPFFHARGHIGRKEEEKAEILDAFISSVFTGKYLRVLNTLDWKREKRSRMKLA